MQRKKIKMKVEIEIINENKNGNEDRINENENENKNGNKNTNKNKNKDKKQWSVLAAKNVLIKFGLQSKSLREACQGKVLKKNNICSFQFLAVFKLKYEPSNQRQ